MARIESPCIGLCSTTLGDEYCRGCKRSADEILSWATLNQNQRNLVQQRIEQASETIVGRYFVLLDKDQLEQQLLQRRIRYTQRFSPLCWVVDLLRVGAHRIQNIEAYGLALTEQGQNQSFEHLYRQLNQQILDEINRLIREK
ncbi:hypothetical protein SAMN02745127_01475 [Oceanospirillum multiglobuliferum]|uniref:DUF1289 domain-containing protein n=1 Tax=Oceanospirillum multiglobuliferum TaxID=64969 RepID=A0A1T4PI04_9GAMM|nr:DUF1289 domain-containing protein [Oceanospirillum multiglobuliferum]OPX55565.1 hypothetical protein BTE48_08065 [Oceanospirillum multiglobuliferum]SJZ90438.1 hypothetical protein SAMN02745127_01475 [Oceanospirillum multiglobuliferum]